MTNGQPLEQQLLGRKPTEAEAWMIILAIEKLQEVVARLRMGYYLPEREVN